MDFAYECDRVLRRLYELRDIGRPASLDELRLLGLTNNQLGECVRALKARGWCDGHIHVTSRDDGGVDHLVAWITEEGIEELGFAIP